MRDFGEKPTTRENDTWWFKGLLLVAGVAITLAHFGLQRSYALERAAVGDREQAEQITEADRQKLTAIILGEN